jgi:hypothetical protein
MACQLFCTACQEKKFLNLGTDLAGGFVVSDWFIAFCTSAPGRPAQAIGPERLILPRRIA